MTGAAEMGFVSRARGIWKRARKDDDFLWARLTARPIAALLLACIKPGRATPNGLSMVSLAFGLGGCAVFAFFFGPVGLWLAWALGQLSYIVDCMDGMLARAEGMESPAGRALDFLVDALKQMWLFPAVGWRLWVDAGQPTGLLTGWALWAAIISGPLVAAALAMTVFLRSPEVTGQPERTTRDAHDRTARGRMAQFGGFLMNYPSWILLPVAFDRLEFILIISLPLYAAHAAWSLRRILGEVCTNEHYDVTGSDHTDDRSLTGTADSDAADTSAEVAPAKVVAEDPAS